MEKRWQTNTEGVCSLPGELGQQWQLLHKKFSWEDDPARKERDPKKKKQKLGYGNFNPLDTT